MESKQELYQLISLLGLIKAILILEKRPIKC